jgi:UDP-N-acetylglucosamine 4,6-dehydratase
MVGDVRDERRLEMVISGGVDYVIHAAALKRVETCAYNPIEAIRTNIDGTANVVNVCRRYPVTRMVFLSTDKAVNPVNLYGVTKAAAEQLTIAANCYKPIYCVTRYGNIMASRGGVLELFLRLSRAGLTALPITHVDMTRFWYTLDLAVDLVVRACAAPPGCLLVGKAPSFRLIDLALTIGGNYMVNGMRPGEKLHETLISEQEVSRTQEYDNYFVVIPDLDLGWDIKYPAGPSIEHSYTSQNNAVWMNQEDIKNALAKISQNPLRRDEGILCQS